MNKGMFVCLFSTNQASDFWPLPARVCVRSNRQSRQTKATLVLTVSFEPAKKRKVSKCEEEKEEEEREESKLLLTLPELFPCTVRSTRLEDQNDLTDYIHTSHKRIRQVLGLPRCPIHSVKWNKQTGPRYICHYNNRHID